MMQGSLGIDSNGNDGPKLGEQLGRRSRTTARTGNTTICIVGLQQGIGDRTAYAGASSPPVAYVLVLNEHDLS
jgi:hypothetical protein